jgi:hypothetical protein
MLAGAALILLGSCDAKSAPRGEPVPGARMMPGKWRFEPTIVEMSSDRLSDSRLERMTNKPRPDERCIASYQTERLADLFPRPGGDCTIRLDEIRNGIVRGRSQCRDGNALAETRIDGRYSATTFEALSVTNERGSTRSDGNVKLTLRVAGRRIGDC